jgi:chromosome segregation ATPase
MVEVVQKAIVDSVAMKRVADSVAAAKALTAHQEYMSDVATIVATSVSVVLAVGVGALIWRLKDAQVDLAKQEVASKDTLLKEQLSAKDAIISSRDAAISSRDAQLQAKDETVRAKESSIAILQEQVRFLDSVSLPKIQERIEAMRKFVEAELERVKSESAKALAEKEAEIKRLQESGAARHQELKTLREEKAALEKKVSEADAGLLEVQQPLDITFPEYTYNDVWSHKLRQPTAPDLSPAIVTALQKRIAELLKTFNQSASSAPSSVEDPAEPVNLLIPKRIPGKKRVE